MRKKTIILSQKQLNEICGGNTEYLDGLSSTPDMGEIFSTEITADGAIDDGYADPLDTNEFGSMQCHDWRSNARMNGTGPITVREMTKRDWEDKFIFENNSRLEKRTFGGNDGHKSYGSTKMQISRKRNAENKMKNGATPEERKKGAKTLQRMRNNWGDLDTAETQYENAKISDKILQNSKPEGSKIASAPKNSGNGKAHSPKNGIITYTN